LSQGHPGGRFLFGDFSPALADSLYDKVLSAAAGSDEATTKRGLPLDGISLKSPGAENQVGES
jgi:hypothetical protein